MAKPLVVTVYSGKSGEVLTDGYYLSISNPRTLRRAKMAAKKQRRNNRISQLKAWFLDIVERGKLEEYTARQTTIDTLEQNIEQFTNDLVDARKKAEETKAAYDAKMQEVEAARVDKGDNLESLRKELCELSPKIAEFEEEARQVDDALKDAKKMLSREKSARTRGQKQLSAMLG